MKLFLTGLPTSGKTTIGKALAEKLHSPFFDTDEQIEASFFQKTGQNLRCCEIYRQEGEIFFRTLEEEIVQKEWNGIIALGGGAKPPKGTIIYLKASPKLLWERIKLRGLPAFLKSEKPEEEFYELARCREPFYQKAATLVVEIDHLSINEVIEKILWAATPSGLFLGSPLGENLMEKP